MDWLYLSKPSGLPTLTPNADPAGDCLSKRLVGDQPAQGTIAWPLGYEAGVLHRLDTLTSGLVIAATSLDAFERGRAAFRSHELGKTYRFLTHKDVPWDENVVAHPISHDKKKKSRMVWLRGQNTPHRGKWHDARTAFRRLGRRGDQHLWEAVITTGVMHQIRVHASSCGLPLLGDRIYGGGQHDRFFLHHARIDGWPEPTPDLPIPEDWPA